ncbi:hypothetical protein Thpro_022400 [Acidihalobacter prosperus]|uniref:Uncharacterized protein n=1 Tax=Acidihalobacter prosperus TaxID=160660 RepID=A0A1A6C0R5_9GAMM|nr:hypothetical protein Thpro_022400 [Acidihalobacter prosperus]
MPPRPQGTARPLPADSRAGRNPPNGDRATRTSGLHSPARADRSSSPP